MEIGPSFLLFLVDRGQAILATSGPIYICLLSLFSLTRIDSTLTVLQMHFGAFIHGPNSKEWLLVKFINLTKGYSTPLSAPLGCTIDHFNWTNHTWIQLEDGLPSSFHGQNEKLIIQIKWRINRQRRSSREIVCNSVANLSLFLFLSICPFYCTSITKLLLQIIDFIQYPNQGGLYACRLLYIIFIRLFFCTMVW